MKPKVKDRGRTGPAADAEAVVRANETFYRALSTKDLIAMDRIWAHEDAVHCIHPGWEVLRGWKVIRQSWRVIFDNPGRLTVKPSDLEVRIHGPLAWVSCLESITAGDDPEPALACATNLFLRTPEGWKMILHHASQIPPSGGEDEMGGPEEGEEEPTIH